MNDAFILTDAAIERALTPGLGVAAPGDFMEHIATAIAPQTRRSRLWLVNSIGGPRRAPLASQLLLALLLLLVLLVVAVAVASLPRKPLANGDVIVASGADLLDVDPATGAARTLTTGTGNLFGVTRSDDGRLISYWTRAVDGTALEILDGKSGDARPVATNVIPRPQGQGQIDVWSPDHRSLAAGVLVNGEARILLVDIDSGNGEYVGPVGASNPLWSPDGRFLAFSYVRDGRSILAVMRPDGSGLAEVSGDLGDLDVGGANSWSPDGAWVYFDAKSKYLTESHIYRVRIDVHHSEQLTSGTFSAAPALSPDGTTIAYSEWPKGLGTQNLMIMDADGGNRRSLLASAINDGWSNDGLFVLAEWRPTGTAYQLVTIRPDGTDRRTLMTFEGGCAAECAPNLGWGQPRP